MVMVFSPPLSAARGRGDQGGEHGRSHYTGGQSPQSMSFHAFHSSFVMVWVEGSNGRTRK